MIGIISGCPLIFYSNLIFKSKRRYRQRGGGAEENENNCYPAQQKVDIGFIKIIFLFLAEVFTLQ